MLCLIMIGVKSIFKGISFLWYELFSFDNRFQIEIGDFFVDIIGFFQKRKEVLFNQIFLNVALNIVLGIVGDIKMNYIYFMIQMYFFFVESRIV